MRAAVVSSSTSGVQLLDVPSPTPGADEVIVEMAACGVCGTDLHVATGDYAPLRLPVVIGHEFAGTVCQVGQDVSSVRVGDRVAVDPSLYCGECEYCAAGRGNLCLEGGGLGTTADGAFAERVLVRARDCYPIPEHLSFDTAALAEPLACAVHGMDLLPRRVGDHYLVYGAGTMGLLLAQLARHAGATSVSVIDLDEARLATADAYDMATATAADALSRSERGWDIVIDCTGAPPAIEDAIAHVSRGGVYLQFGVTSMAAQVPINPFRLFRDEITLLGSRAIHRSFGRAVELLAAGVVDTDRLVSDRLPLRDIDVALRRVADGAGGKVLIHQ